METPIWLPIPSSTVSGPATPSSENDPEPDAITIDAAIVAAGLGMEPSSVHLLMREGRITSLCERGVGEDDGLHRLTFFYENRRLIVIVDGAGNVARSSAINFGKRPLPLAMRRPQE